MGETREGPWEKTQYSPRPGATSTILVRAAAPCVHPPSSPTPPLLLLPAPPSRLNRFHPLYSALLSRPLHTSAPSLHAAPLRQPHHAP
ncbi:hypothetical protein K523DRAFT_320471, partial [Schizophyllum commune Tattone D]